jgi:hypothetical protein
MYFFCVEFITKPEMGKKTGAISPEKFFYAQRAVILTLFDDQNHSSSYKRYRHRIIKFNFL